MVTAEVVALVLKLLEVEQVMVEEEQIAKHLSIQIILAIVLILNSLSQVVIVVLDLYL